MPIYFPRGFPAGEPVEVLDGVTLLCGKLADQKVDLLVLPVWRGRLGSVRGPVRSQAGAVLAAAGAAAARALRQADPEPGVTHLVGRGRLRAARLALLEVERTPRGAGERLRWAQQVLDCALVSGAREVAVGPFEAGVAGARHTLEALRRARLTREDPAELPRALLVVPDARTFRSVLVR